jgi:hypothetical protein
MEMRDEGLPYAGERFRFTILGGTPVIRIKAYIDSKQVLSTDCPDPPCHEVVQIPAGTRGAILRIVATDRLGSKFEQEYVIAEADRGGAMLAAR